MLKTGIPIVGIIGGILWAYNSDWDYEPIILTITSILSLLALNYNKLKINANEEREKKDSIVKQNLDSGKSNINTQIGISGISNSSINLTLDTEKNTTSNSPNERDEIIELKKQKVGVLFIDDDSNFNIVKILKDSGWKKTKTIEDLKNLDLNIVKESQIIFVDISGVGKLLNLENEGLDLALMLKQKYPSKYVIIYSAKRNTNAFHKAWEVVDGKLEKNALPYQFQQLVEEFSLKH